MWVRTDILDNMKKIKTLALISVLFFGVTTSVLASWWNPFTWSLFTEKQVSKPKEREFVNKNSGFVASKSPNKGNGRAEVDLVVKDNKVYIGNKFEVTIPSAWKEISIGSDNLKIVSPEYSENSSFSKNESERNIAEIMPVKSGSMIVVNTKDTKELATRLLDPVQYSRFYVDLGKYYSGVLVSKEISVAGVPAAFSQVSFNNGSFATYIKLIINGEQFEINFYTTKNESDSIVLESLLLSFKFIE